MRGLSLRYWLVVSGLLTAFLLIGGIVEIVSAFGENTRRIAAVQRAEAQLVAGRVSHELSTIESNLRDTAGLPWQHGLLGLKELQQEFQRLMKLLPALYEIRAYDASGTEVLLASRIKPDRVAPTPGSSGGRAAHGAVAYGSVEYRRGSEPFVVLHASAAGANDLFHRIEADLNLKFVSDVIGSIPAGPQQAAYVVDGADNLIAHSDPSMSLRRLNVGGLAHIAAIRRAGEGRPELRSGIAAVDMGGREIVASGASIAAPGWYVVVEQPMSVARRDAWATARRTAILVVAGLLAAVLVSFLLARRMSGPILEVRRGAERIARGDLAVRIQVRTGDEVEDLAMEFNAMAAQLAEYTEGLERKVSEKTAQLQATDAQKTELLKRVEAERSIAEDALRMAQEAMRARALFLAAASHDLRQPLYAISLLAETLSEEPLPESAVSLLDKQRQAIRVLQTLFENLLDLSRFDAGEIRPEPRVASLREILGPIATEYEVVCAAKALQWSCRISDLHVSTDPELVRRLARNLLSNAARYTERGAVSFSAEAAGDRALVVVSDTGVGIPPSEQGRVFEEFVQLRNPGRDRDKGVGLGLSIVKRIGELLDAHVALESVPGSGTRVSFGLPLAQPWAEAARADAPPGTAEMGIEGMRLWIVEDDAMVRDALAEHFDRRLVDHAFAADRAGIEALHASDGEWPEAVMLDDMLHGGERGLDLAYWLVQRMDSSRILLVTGNLEPGRLAQLQASPFMLLRKPLSTEQLDAWLRRARPAPGAVRPSPAATRGG